MQRSCREKPNEISFLDWRFMPLGKSCRAKRAVPNKSPARGDGRGRRSLAGAADFGGSKVATNLAVARSISNGAANRKRAIGSAAMQFCRQFGPVPQKKRLQPKLEPLIGPKPNR